MNKDTKRARCGSLLPARRAGELDLALAPASAAEAEMRPRAAADLDVVLSVSAALQQATPGGYFADGADPALTLAVEVRELRLRRGGGQWLDLLAEEAATDWTLADARFAVTCFYRPASGFDASFRSFFVTFRGQSAGLTHAKSFTVATYSPPLADYVMNAPPLSALDAWPSEENATLPLDTAVVVRVEAFVPMVALNAPGPWKGLKNHGCTCYLNSLMQCLFHINAFRCFVYSLTGADDRAVYERVLSHLSAPVPGPDDALPDLFRRVDEEVKQEFGDYKFANRLTPEDLARFTQDRQTICGVELRQVLSVGQTTHGALQRLFAQMEPEAPLDSGARVVAPVECLPLIITFGWQNEDLFTQHDVEELNRLLVDKLEKVGTASGAEAAAAGAALKTLFCGEMESYIECIDVDYKSKRVEEFYDLQLDLRSSELMKSINEDLHEVEILENENAYDAGTFGRQKARKGIRILRYAKIQQFHLKRFKFDYSSFIKMNDAFEFHPEITLHGKTYRLVAVSVHQGDINSGHYYSYVNCVMPGTDERQWFLFDDEAVQMTNAYAAIENNFGGSFPSMLNRYEDLTAEGSSATVGEECSSPSNSVLGDSNGYTPPFSGAALPRQRPDSAYLLFYSRVDDVAVDIWQEQFRPLLLRLYLEQSYRRHQERLNSVVQSSLLICAPSEEDILRLEPAAEGEQEPDIGITGLWQNVSDAMVASYPTYLRPMCENASTTWQALCPPEESDPPTCVTEDFVDRPTCPHTLNYLDLVRKVSQNTALAIEHFDRNGLSPGLRNLRACETEQGLTLWTLEYADKDHPSAIGKNYEYVTKDLRPREPLPAALFTLLKVPVPTVVPPEITLTPEARLELAASIGHLRQERWRAVPLKVFDPFSLNLYFFGFASVFHVTRNMKASLAHVIGSVYSTIVRNWFWYRSRYQARGMSATLTKFLDTHFKPPTPVDGTPPLGRHLDKNTSTPRGKPRGSMPFFLPCPEAIANLLEHQCQVHIENLGWFEPTAFDVLDTTSFRTRITTLSFDAVIEAYATSPQRIEHVLDGHLFPKPKVLVFGHPPLVELARPTIECFASNASSTLEPVPSHVECTAAALAEAAAALTLSTPMVNVCDVLCDMRRFVHLELQVLKNPGRLVGDLITSHGALAAPPGAVEYTVVKLCVCVEWTMRQLFSAIAWAVSGDASGAVEPENLLLSAACPLWTALFAHTASDETLNKNGFGGFLWLNKFASDRQSCCRFLRLASAAQDTFGYSPRYKNLIPSRESRIDSKRGPCHVRPVKVAVIRTQASVREACQIIAYEHGRARQGLALAIDCHRLRAQAVIEKVFEALGIGATSQAILYTFQNGLALTLTSGERLEAEAYPVLRLSIIDAPTPLMEVVVNGFSHFVPVDRETTLAEVFQLLGMKPPGEVKVALQHLADNTQTILYDLNSKQLPSPRASTSVDAVLDAKASEGDCGRARLWSVALTVAEPVKPKKQMTLN